MLTIVEKQSLLLIARFAALRALGLRVPGKAPEPSGALLEPGAAFVTWRREGRLRGCIGSVEPSRPLGEDVAQNSVEALLHDPRFPPATAREFPRYQVEISVLTARESIEGPADIEIGRHGLYVEKASRRGLLLPQVAPEWGWTPEKFLGQVCLKAGLPADAWQNGNPRATVSRFGADVFSEDLLLVTPAT